MFSSCTGDNGPTFFERVKDRKQVNFAINKKMIEGKTQLFSRFGSGALYVTLTSLGNVADSYYTVTEKYPPLFATLGGFIALVAHPRCVIETMYNPFNHASSYVDALGEELVISMKASSKDFEVGFMVVNDALLSRYEEKDNDDNVIEREGDRKLSHWLFGITGGGVFSKIFTSQLEAAGNWVFPFAASLGIEKFQLAYTAGATATYMVARPAAKIASFGCGLVTTLFGPIYRRCNKTAVPEKRPEDMLLNGGGYDSPVIHAGRPSKSHTRQ